MTLSMSQACPCQHPCPQSTRWPVLGVVVRLKGANLIRTSGLVPAVVLPTRRCSGRKGRQEKSQERRRVGLQREQRGSEAQGRKRQQKKVRERAWRRREPACQRRPWPGRECVWLRTTGDQCVHGVGVAPDRSKQKGKKKGKCVIFPPAEM